jgi:hypothetical protein
MPTDKKQSKDKKSDNNKSTQQNQGGKTASAPGSTNDKGSGKSGKRG